MQVTKSQQVINSTYAFDCYVYGAKYTKRNQSPLLGQLKAYVVLSKEETYSLGMYFDNTEFPFIDKECDFGFLKPLQNIFQNKFKVDDDRIKHLCFAWSLELVKDCLGYYLKEKRNGR